MPQRTLDEPRRPGTASFGTGSPRVEKLFTSAGHNFFGHHGRQADEHPACEMAQIECVAGRGIRGDRFFDYRDNYKGQITFFSRKVFDALKQELHLPQAQPAALRRNVLISNGDLNRWIGMRFELQGVVFEGTEECRPGCGGGGLAARPGWVARPNPEGGSLAGERRMTPGVVAPFRIRICHLDAVKMSPESLF